MLDKQALPPLIAGAALIAIAVGVQFVLPSAENATDAAGPQDAEGQEAPEAAADLDRLAVAPGAGAPSGAADAPVEERAEDAAPAEADARADLVAEREAARVARDAELPRLEAALAEKGRDLEAREAEIAGLRAALAARGAELPRLEARLALDAEAVAGDAPYDALKFPGAEAAEPAAARSPLALPGDLAMPATAPRPRALPVRAPLPARAGPLPRPEAAVPDPPPVAASAAPAPHMTATLLAEVHFELSSAALSPGARRRAEEAAAAIAALAPRAVRLAGHADRTGPVEFNERLSRARAEAVAAILMAAGVPGEAIAIAAFGERPEHLPIPTGRGVAEPLNRCVAIWIEPAYTAAR